MLPYTYSPLSNSNATRLLRLLPSSDPSADLRCEIIEYTISDSGTASHPYEALSYVWGDATILKSIVAHDTSELAITPNLHAALLRLRDLQISRLLWVDAVCINQADDREKERQIQFMVAVFAKARSVIVWLGDGHDAGEHALETLRVAAEASMPIDALGHKSHSPRIDDSVQQSIELLVQRPWFRRVWILQEMAAARHVIIICGSVEIDGHAFCTGLDSLERVGDSVALVADLIRGAILRPRPISKRWERYSLDIRPLGELIDMFHTYDATILHDKIFALLGMSSDDHAVIPSYSTSWSVVMCKLIAYMLGDKVSISSLQDGEIAVIKGKGCIIGNITCAFKGSGDRYQATFAFGNTSKQSGWQVKDNVWWLHRPSRTDKAIQAGDLVCLLEGASRPTIIRLQDDYAIILSITSLPAHLIPTAEKGEDPGKALQGIKFMRDFVLIWDWNPPKDPQPGREYDKLLQYASNSRLDGELQRIAALWNVALIAGDAGKHEAAEKKSQKVAARYDSLLRDLSGTGRQEYFPVPLLLAARHGYTEVVRQMLAYNSMTRDLQDWNSRTPLSWAASGGHAAIVELLLGCEEVMADPKDNLGRTPLSYAVQGGHHAVVQQLLQRSDVDINSVDRDGRSPLFWRKSSGCQLVKLLIEHGAHVDSVFNGDQPALMWEDSCEDERDCRGKIEVTELLIKHGARVHDRDKHGNTPLLSVVNRRCVPEAKLLLQNGADVNCRNNNGGTPLLVAVQKRHEAMVRLLVEQGAVSDCPDRNGWTALSLAAAKGLEEIARTLLDRGASIDIRDKQKRTPLFDAASGNQVAVVRLLLEHGANVDLGDSNGQTALAEAARHGRAAVVRMLLAHGANIEPSGQYRSALYVAAEEGHYEVAKVLLQNDADVNVASTDGTHTALTRAVETNNEQMVLLLLTYGAKTNATDVHGCTALSRAAEKGKLAMVRLLLEHGADIEAIDKDNGSTALLHAAKAGHGAIVKLLLEYGADMEASDRKQRRTALSLAAEHNHKDLAMLLLQSGCNPEARDEAGRTAMFWATRRPGNEVAELLSRAQTILPKAKMF